MKFMVCYDGSEAAKSAMKLAQKDAKGSDVKLEVVTHDYQGTSIKAHQNSGEGR